MRYLAFSMLSPWETYTSPLVRDLAWLAFSPTLLTHSPLDIAAKPFSLIDFHDTQRFLNWLNELDTKTDKELALLLDRQDYKRLGLYCEALFEVLTTYGFDAGAIKYKLVTRNVQIKTQDAKVTLGELDFLLETKQSDLIHVEMAIKYYLFSDSPYSITPPSNTKNISIPSIAQRCIGPNRSDRLDIKLDRLLSHQLPLCHKKLTLTQLAEKNINTHLLKSRSELFLKGQIFHYFSHIHTLLGDNTFRSSQKWSHINRALSAMAFCENHFQSTSQPHHKWYVLEKLDWLTGAADRHQKSYTKEQVANELIDNTSITFKPPVLLQLISTQQKNKNTSPHVIKLRLMLVHNDWPQF